MAKSTRSSNKKTNRLVKWLRPNSPTKGMLLFVLVFGVVGSSYFLSKSFAASSTKMGGNIQNAGGAYTTRHCWSSKNCHLVWVVLPNTGGVITKFSRGNVYKACMKGQFTRGQGGPVRFTVTFGGDGLVQTKTIPPGNLKSVCANWSPTSQLVTHVRVQNAAPAYYDNLLVDSISIHW